jgi:4-hydroxy-3-methylbut-2-enyl diphosphate reductase IspH
MSFHTNRFMEWSRRLRNPKTRCVGSYRKSKSASDRLKSGVTNTVCQPTKQRQTSAIELAKQCDVVIFIGGAKSNNTRELAASCSKYWNRAHHVQWAGDLRVEWFVDANITGITAGTSTPESTIREIENCLHEIARHEEGMLK